MAHLDAPALSPNPQRMTHVLTSRGAPSGGTRVLYIRPQEPAAWKLPLMATAASTPVSMDASTQAVP